MKYNFFALAISLTKPRSYINDTRAEFADVAYKQLNMTPEEADEYQERGIDLEFSMLIRYIEKLCLLNDTQELQRNKLEYAKKVLKEIGLLNY